MKIDKMITLDKLYILFIYTNFNEYKTIILKHYKIMLFLIISSYFSCIVKEKSLHICSRLDQNFKL